MKKLFPFILLMVFAVTAGAQTVSFTISAPACHNDGVLTATFAGLTPPLTVQWTTEGTAGSTIIHTGVTSLTDALTGYSGGPVFITATDSVGGSASNDFVGSAPFTICPLTTHFGLCPAPDTLSASVCSGGTGPFTYRWYDINTTGFVDTTATITVRSGDTYGVTVTDALGCTYGSLVDGSLAATAVAVATFADSITTTLANCTNGTATATAYGGGVPPFSYLWSNGATTATITGLITGTYSVVITDALGCTNADTTAAEVLQSIVISVPVTTTPATCTANDGAVIAFGSGGVPPYTYVWSNGATTQSQGALAGGIYNVNVTDANGCIGNGFAFVSTSTPITVTYTTTPSSCTSPTGTATLTLAGGTAPYATLWHTVPPQYSLTATGLTYGTYGFQVTDAIGCIQTGSVYIPPIDVMSVSFLSTPALCTLSNGALTAYPTGGATPYTYSWSTGATTAGITSKPSGTYSVTITDFAGCKVTKEPYLPDYSPLGVNVTSVPASCIFANDGKDSATAWGGTTPYTYAWSNGVTLPYITSLYTGPYWLTVTDATGCRSDFNYSYVDYDHTADDCYCTISGTVYNDINRNCVQDAGEAGIPNVQIHIAGTSPYSGYTYTDALGNYAYKVPTGIYTVSQTILAFYPLASCQPNNIPVSVVGATGCVHTVNFADSMDTIHDMHISTWDYLYRGPVVGHSYTQATIISNDGTVTEDSVYASYKTDGQLFAPTFVPGGYFNGGSNYYNTADSFTSLTPGASKQFFMNYAVPTDIPINTSVVFKDSVVYKAPATNWLTDYSPWNNVSSLTTVTTASFDPNFKEVSPKGTGANGTIAYTDSVLEYMVHFQNTGTAPAENIVVIDTLDANLDWTTLRPVFESAPCKVTMQAAGTSGIVKFTFTDINLPAASTDLVRSNGMFTYTIHTVAGKPIGTQFKNSASIYFDFNAPVRTNTTVNTLGSVAPPNVGVSNVTPGAANTFAVYPNPASNTFSAIINAANAGPASLNVSDITGRVLLTKILSVQKGAQTIPVDANQLASGTYFVSFIANGATQTQKLVIIK